MGNTLTPYSTGTPVTPRRERSPGVRGRSRRLARLAVMVVGVSGLGVLALSAAAQAECPNEAARTGPSAALPDCRAYELVTPADKSSAVQDLDPFSANARVAVTGNRIALKTPVEFGPRPMPKGSFSVFARTSSGWQIESVPPPGAGSAFYEAPIFNPNMTEIGVSSYATTPISPDETYQIGPPGGPYNTTIAKTPTNYLGPGVGDFLAGATEDFSRVFLDSTDHTLLSGSPTGTVEGAHDIYEWEDGELRRLVNVESDGSVVGSCGAQFDFASNDGSKVVFASPDVRLNPEATSDPSCQQGAQLYERVNGSSTVEVSKPNTGVVDPTGPHPAQFQGASEDGSKVFFTTEAELTHDDEGIHDKELYEYDASAKEGEKLTRISAGTTGTAGGEVQYEEVVVSGDGSEVYFYGKGKLTPEAQSTGIGGQVVNVYGYDTTTGEIRYIATAEEEQYAPSVDGTKPRPSGAEGQQVTPDGRFFAFTARSAGYDEIYRYDNETGSLICVSCAPNGAPARGGASLTAIILSTWDEIPSENTISEDGSYVFFESNDELVPQDVNGTGGKEPGDAEYEPWTDVYEWHDGVISLISSGTSSQETALIGASANGSNVFFMTHSQLVPQDTGTSNNIYDARIDGGFPPPVESAACLGDTCLSPPVAPNDPTPATSSLPGPGNLVPLLVAPKPKPKAKRCGKGKVRKKGRCVKRRGKGKVARRAVKHDRGGSK